MSEVKIDSEQFQQLLENEKFKEFTWYDEDTSNYKSFSKNLRKLIQLENLEIKMIQPTLQNATYWLAEAINQLTYLKSIKLNIEGIYEDFQGMTFLKKSFQNLKQLEKLSLNYSKSGEYFMKQRYFDQLLKGISYLTNLKQLDLQFESINFNFEDIGKNIVLDQLTQLTSLFISLEIDEHNTKIEQYIFKVIKSIQNIVKVSIIIRQESQEVEDLKKEQLKQEEEFLLIGDDHLDNYQQSFEQIPQQWNRIQNLYIQISQSIIRESSLSKFFSNINPNSINEINCRFKIASINTLKHIFALNNLKKLTFSVDLLYQTSSQEISPNNSLEFVDLTFKPKGFIKSKDNFGALLQNLQNLKTCNLKFDNNKEQGYSFIKIISKSFYKLNNLTELELDDYFSMQSYLLEESLSAANGIGQLINLQSLIVQTGLFQDTHKFKELIKNILKLNKLIRLSINLTYTIDHHQIIVNLKLIKKLIKFDKFNQFYVKFSNPQFDKAIINFNKEKLFLSMILPSHFQEELELTLSFIDLLQKQRSLHLILYLDDREEQNSLSNKKIDQSCQILNILKTLLHIQIHELQIINSKFDLNKEFFLQLLQYLSNIQQLNKLSLSFKSLIPSIKLRQLIIKKLPKLICINDLKIEENLQIEDEDIENLFSEDSESYFE